MTTYIYALIDPRGPAIRYIGKTSNPRKRIAHHLWRARNRHLGRCARWLRGLLQRGMIPAVMVLEACEGDGFAEEHHHVELAQADGLRLTNLTHGGGGLTGQRRPRSVVEKIRAANLGRKHTPEAVENNRQGQLQRFASPASKAHREALSVAARLRFTGRKRTPEAIEKVAAALRGRVLPIEVKAKIAERRAANPWHPSREQIENVRRKNIGQKRTPEQRARMAAAMRGITHPPLSPEHKAKISAALRKRVITAETRAKIGDIHRGKVVSAETRLRMSEAAKRRVQMSERDERGRIVGCRRSA